METPNKELKTFTEPIAKVSQFAHTWNTDNIQNLLFVNPTILNRSNWEETAKALLPYDTGIEIECHRAAGFDPKLFTDIPYLIKFNGVDSEERFRIPPGFDGFMALYYICEVLKKQNVPTDSGIHIHTDFRHSFDKLNREVLAEHKEWMLEELDLWDYKGTYNQRDVRFSRCWVRCHTSFSTLEYRTCEMTFDYKLICSRITHCHAISEHLSKNILAKVWKYNDLRGIFANRKKAKEIIASRTLIFN